MGLMPTESQNNHSTLSPDLRFAQKSGLTRREIADYETYRAGIDEQRNFRAHFHK